MNAAMIASKAVCDFIDADPSRFTAGCTPSMLVGAALAALEAKGFAIVKMPEADSLGTYDECAIEGGDEIAIDRPWVNARQARVLAADLLRAAAQIEADQIEAQS